MIPFFLKSDTTHLRTRSAILPAAILAIITLLTFEQSLHCDFVNFDDDVNVYENPYITSFSRENLRWMLTEVHAGHYHPLTWLSLALDYQLWDGLKPMGFHLTNLLLHGVMVLGFYAVCLTLLRRCAGGGVENGGTNLLPAPVGGQAVRDAPFLDNDAGDMREALMRWSAAWGAALFAVHPMRVESVVWITERRDVLSGAWMVLCVWMYLRAAQTRRGGAYVAWMSGSLAAFILSLLSKAWGITLPVVLLLMDVWPLRRIHWQGWRPRAGSVGVWVEKMLFVVPSLAAAAAALSAQNASGALQPLDSYPISRRLVQTAYGIMFYPVKTLVPVNLIPVYGWPEEVGRLYLPAAMGALSATVISILVWRVRHRWPAAGTIWLTYVILVSPVLGLAQSGPQLVADRYTYIAMLPAAAGAAGVLYALMERYRQHRRRLVHVAIGAGVVVAVLVRLTQSQIPVWRDKYTLWDHQLKVCPDSPIGHVNRAAALFEDGLRFGAANREGDRVQFMEEALRHYRRALELRPRYLIAARGVGRCLSALDRPQEALEMLEFALSIKPQDSETLFEVADAKAVLGRLDEAIELYRRVVANGDRWQADAHYEAGRLLYHSRRLDQAVEELLAYIRLRPDEVNGYIALAEAYIGLDRDTQAAEALEQLLRIDPDHLAGQARLAFVLASTNVATLRDPARAMRLAARAFDAAPRGGMEFHEALAAACAANGQFDRAIGLLDEILARVKPESSPPWAQRLTRQRERYVAGLALEE